MPRLAPSDATLGSSPPGHARVIVDASGTYTLAAEVSTSLFADDLTLFADDSDATYVEHWRSSSEIASTGSIVSDMAPAPGRQLLEFPLTVRAMLHDDGTGSEWSTRILFDIYNLDTGDYLGLFSYGYAFGISLPSTDVIYTITGAEFVPDTAHGQSFATLNAAVQNDGIRINYGAFVGPETGVVRMLRVYEMYFGIQGGGQPLRRYPRADGLGVGPARHYPPPESRRGAGGYH